MFHFNFVLCNVIINRFQILGWQIFTVIDTAVHLDVLFFRDLTFHLVNIYSIQYISYRNGERNARKNSLELIELSSINKVSVV